MGQLLYVETVVFAVELLEDGQQTCDVMRTIDRELHRLVFPHYTAKRSIIPQILEHTQCENGKEA